MRPYCAETSQSYKDSVGDKQYSEKLGTLCQSAQYANTKKMLMVKGLGDRSASYDGASGDSSKV